MTIKVKEYRGLEINLDNAETGDTLLVLTTRGTPILLSFVKEQSSCLRRWRYIDEGMWPVDAEQVQRIVNDAVHKATSEVREALASATISTYVGLRVALDKPLNCQVEAAWPNAPETSHRKQPLGVFTSGGGLIKSVQVVPVPART